jgi:hypothetical protein
MSKKDGDESIRSWRVQARTLASTRLAAVVLGGHSGVRFVRIGRERCCLITHVIWTRCGVLGACRVIGWMCAVVRGCMGEFAEDQSGHQQYHDRPTMKECPPHACRVALTARARNKAEPSRVRFDAYSATPEFRREKSGVHSRVESRLRAGVHQSRSRRVRRRSIRTFARCQMRRCVPPLGVTLGNTERWTSRDRATAHPDRRVHSL